MVSARSSPAVTPTRRSTRGLPIAYGAASTSGSALAIKSAKYVWQEHYPIISSSSSSSSSSTPILSLTTSASSAATATAASAANTVDPSVVADIPLATDATPKVSITVSSGATQIVNGYSSFLRIGAVLPSDQKNQKKRSRGRDDEAGREEDSVPQLRFSVGDGVIVACHGSSIGVAILTDLWEEEEEVKDQGEVDAYADADDEDREDDDADDGDDVRITERDGASSTTTMRAGSPPSTATTHKKKKSTVVKKCRVRWCYRKQDLPTITMRQLKLVDHELLYSSSQTRPVTSDLALDSLIHTCTIIDSDRFKQLYPMYHSSWDQNWKVEVMSDRSGSEEPKSESEEAGDKGVKKEGKGEGEDGDGDEDEGYMALAKRIPPSLNLATSNTSFNAHKRAIPLVYFVDKAFDKFGKGGEGKSWWDVDWNEVATKGREEKDWEVKPPATRPRQRTTSTTTKGGKSDITKSTTRREKTSRELESEDEVEEDESSSSEFEHSDNGSEPDEDALEGEAESDEENGTVDEVDSATTPRKRRGKAAKTTTTPRKRKSTAAVRATPASKRQKVDGKPAKMTTKKRRQHLQAPNRGITSEIAPHLLPKDPYERALHLLHVGATPDSLPCREDEFVDVMTKVEEGIESGGGGCLYISGVPGTGKTATVHAVIKELTRKAEEGDLAPFSYVEINGLKVPTPQHAYITLWEAISGQKVSNAKVALRGLEEHFGNHKGASGPRGHTFVVLMDELDQLLTQKQDVVYNFFNWPALKDSQLFVVAVANRMDLPQHLAAKVKSRLGLSSLLFQPYDKPALVEIVQSRLIPHPHSQEDHKILAPEAIELAAAKMAGTNGDARRVLDACRRAVEVAMETAKQNRAPKKAVTIREMSGVLRAMTSSPIALYIKQCSLHQKMMLAAMLRCIRREGVPEISWRSLRADHDNLIRSISDSNDILNHAELFLVFSSLVASHALTCSNEKYRHMDDRKVAMGLDSNEVGRVLMGEGDRWNQVLAGM